MNDFLHQLIKENTLWRQGGWHPVSRCRADILGIVEKLSCDVAVVPSFRDSHLFLSCMVASLLVRAPLVFLSDRSSTTLDRLRSRYDLLFATDDGVTKLAQHNERTLHIAPANNENRTSINYCPHPNQLVLEVQTSGSTGSPHTYHKSWSGLIEEADTIGRGLRINSAGQHVISTVPLHHMYGFSYALLGPLRWGMSIDAERPVYPKDLSRVLASAPGPSWVVTTPVHLRAYVASTERLHKLAGFICSAAPLPVELAKAAEERFGCPVIETYGSTETGAIAWRHAARNDIWTTYDALTVSVNDGLVVYAAHLPAGGQFVDDRVELLDERRFRIVGRSADLIKIAGKRASLSELSNKLKAIDGVEDGVFLQPPGKAEVEGRLAAFAVIRNREPDAILKELRDRIDSVFLPRPFVPVAQLPRNENGKLTREALESLWHACTEATTKVNRLACPKPVDGNGGWETRVPELEIMNNAAENAAYDRIATRWLDKVIYPALIKNLNRESSRRVLDVCSGSGRLALALMRKLPSATVHGIDLSHGMLGMARANAESAGVADRVTFHLEDAAATSFDDGQFDAAIGYGALHHWEEPQAVFAELVRVVRPGGQIVIGDWRRDPSLIDFFRSQRGTAEWLLIEASARAAYRVEEVVVMLEPLSLLCEWQVTQHPMGLLVRGRTLEKAELRGKKIDGALSPAALRLEPGNFNVAGEHSA